MKKTIDENGRAEYKFDEEIKALCDAGFTEEQIKAIWDCVFAIAQALTSK